MEVIAFAIGLDPIITRGQQLVVQFRTWKDNKKQAPGLCDSFKVFEKDLDACINGLQEKAVNLPQESRAIIEHDVTTLSVYLTDADTVVQSLIKRMDWNRMLQFFRAKAVANDIQVLSDKLDEAQKLVRDVDKFADLRAAVQRIEKGVDSVQRSYSPSSSILATARGSEEVAKHDSFHPCFDTTFDASKLVFDFNTRDEGGNVSSQEGRLLELLLDTSPNRSKAIAVRGIGGVGKTSLLRGIRGLETVKNRFEDGICNIVLGRDATRGELIQSLSAIVQSSGGELQGEAMRFEIDMEKVMNMCRSWFAGKQCLFVVDDVWETKEIPTKTIHELTKLHATGRDSTVLLTTRSPKISSEADTYFCLEPRHPLDGESRAILLEYSEIEPEGAGDDQKVVDTILEQCSGLPLFLAVAGKCVKTLSFRRGHEGCMAYRVYAQSLESSRQSLLATGVGDYEELSARLMVSLEVLEERKPALEFRIDRPMGEIHRRLSVMAKQTRVPMSMLKQLWELENESQAATLAREFEQVGLADVEFESRGSQVIEFLRLHDSVYEFAVSETRKHEEETVGHETLLRRYGEALIVKEMCGEWWHTCLKSDGYIHGNVCRHLLGARRVSDVAELLLKPQWAERQLNVNGIPFLTDDLSRGIEAVHNGVEGYTEEQCSETEEALQLVLDAVTLSSPYISKNKVELYFQLHGRLKRYGNRKRLIREYVGRMERETIRPRVLCLNDFLGGPGGKNTNIISVGTSVHCMVLLDCAYRVACGGANGFIVVVNVREREIEKEWKAHDGTVFAIAVGRGGSRLVSGSNDGTAKVWDVATGRHVSTFEGHTAAVRGVGVLKDELRVVSVSWDGTVQVWEMVTGRVILPTCRGHAGGVSCVAVWKDRDEFITGGKDGKLILRSGTTGAQLGDPFEGHEGDILCAAVTPDGHRIVSVSEDCSMRVWDVASHTQIMESFVGHSRAVTCVGMSTDGCHLVSGSKDRTIRVWDYESGQQVGDWLEGHGLSVTGVSFMTSVYSIVSCSYDGTVRIWDLRRKKALRAASQHDSVVYGVAYTPNGKFVVSGSLDMTLRIWDPTTGQQVGDPLQGHSDQVLDVAVTRDGRYVVSVSRDRTVGVWDFESREMVHAFKGHTNSIWCVAVAPNGRWAVTGSEDTTVRIWDLSAMDGSHIVLEGHDVVVVSVFVTDDGLRVVSVDIDDAIFVWEPDTKKIVKRFKKEDACRLSRVEVLLFVGETTIQDNVGLSISRRRRKILYGQDPDEKVLATLECPVWSWDLSPDKNTICIGLHDGHVAFLKLEP